MSQAAKRPSTRKRHWGGRKPLEIAIGTRFARLTILSEIEGIHTKDGRIARRFATLCDCGNVKVTKLVYLRQGSVQSCGCQRLERSAEGSRRKLTTHGDTHPRTPEYRSWEMMRARCYNPNKDSYPRYGGRGITVCERWRDNYANFLEDMGRKPSHQHTLDRIDNSRNYEPANCRWATATEQANNRRPPRPRRK